MKKPYIVIPALDPDHHLLTLVDEVTAKDPDWSHFLGIVIVDDGSQSKSVFQELANRHRIHILEHEENQGKGAALRTAFRWILSQQEERCSGAVTADADGQHLAEDILAVCTRLKGYPDKLWLGSRTFDENDIPLRSKVGNKLTRVIFRLVTGQDIKDTQTGLRGVPVGFLEKLVDFNSCGYEFELEMLLSAKRYGYRIKSQEITTVYEEGNETSHYRPIVDSIKIYRKFLKFASIGILSAGLDYSVFATAYFFSGQVLESIILARVISGVFNFSLNRQWVFKQGSHIAWDATKYGCLAVVLVAANYGLTEAFRYIGLTPFIGKPLAEGLVFLLSYRGQKLLVFKKAV
ncbi:MULTISPECIES: bifunctional glycosyltransferase family 2/GtrA family protein [Idiomarina]|jgi:glycosyltransferase involved in cell wall biosynthesis|uniref:bifunctional glycosyltransferase family 2/GtrA family protein n=1 Tax=Idiomarina TaxID=135575 RepID=UPI000C0A1EEE|nr:MULTISPECIES: bifunctional glycosyltransferase family 2/GtrA family protein [Idiomarina]MAL83909.1 glycosyltransferase [Idiomarina sp.]MBH95397.1 glycosyltransferase [Idiomarina sp.]MBP58470.1 glycosyltransferase [Idiomarina sp.]MDA6065931.1 bifunctional glycosyltransferase family 2/GtrA family protein [Idiomarina abyssalis]QZN89888.1 bifunctional glycosyltransferase family 2/GtrA family protein [Idiomarina abyssalis]|tara:strand:- start:4733 stop:5776 length:1044 start_codon:yes stop_codon:yes gene_type:complete